MEPFNLKKVAAILKPLREQGKSGDEIAQALGAAGLNTISGKPWTESMVSQIARNHLKMPSKYSAYNRGKKRKRTVAANGHDEPSYRDIEEIVTSNLPEKLKMKFISTLAKSL